MRLLEPNVASALSRKLSADLVTLQSVPLLNNVSLSLEALQPRRVLSDFLSHRVQLFDSLQSDQRDFGQ